MNSTKVNDFDKIVRICEQKMVTGDYKVVADALGMNVDAVRMAFYRRNNAVVMALYDAIKHREHFVHRYKSRV